MIILTAILLPLFLLVYAWLLYPVILGLLVAHNKRIPPRAAFGVFGETPVENDGNFNVAVMFSAHNEEKHIKARLENLLSLSFPQSALQIHVGVDGATDATAAVSREFAKNHANVHVHEFPERRGKTAVLKDMISCGPTRGVGNVQHKGTDILVFTDANTLFYPDTLEKLMVPFANPRIGGVCGRLEMREDGGRKTVALGDALPEKFYWEWESRLKEYESALDSCLGANGAIYAVRRELFWDEIPDNAIVDDFIIGMKVREKGFKMVYEPRARAWEALPQSGDEWGRRVRIGAGDYQALRFCRKCLSPRYGKFAWMFWSHKALRWFTPHILILLLAGLTLGVWRLTPSICRAAGACGARACLPFAAFGAVLILFLWALMGVFANDSVMGRACRHFLSMQAALFVGFLRFCRGGLKGYWQRTPRV